MTDIYAPRDLSQFIEPDAVLKAALPVVPDADSLLAAIKNIPQDPPEERTRWVDHLATAAARLGMIEIFWQVIDEFERVTKSRDVNDEHAVRDLNALATDPESREFIRKHAATAAQVQKQRDWQPEPDPFAPSTYTPGNWVDIPAELYEAYRAGHITFSHVQKSLAEDVYIEPAEAGQAWLDSLNDPRQAARASRDYESQRRGLVADDDD